MYIVALCNVMQNELLGRFVTLCGIRKIVLDAIPVSLRLDIVVFRLLVAKA